MKKELKKLTGVLLLVAMAVCVNVFAPRQCQGQQPEGDTVSIRRDTVRDTVPVVIHDTVPVMQGQRTIGYIFWPSFPADSVKGDTTQAAEPPGTVKGDSIAVVQRVYSDDTTYTAYVSGVQVCDWPRLDSINIRQRAITNTIRETITIRGKASRWKVGLQAGYGYGMRYGGLEPYIGIGVSYTLWSP